MARHRRKRSLTRKNPKRVRSAKRAYKKSGLYKFNLRRKKSGGRKKKYAKRAKHHTRKHAKRHTRRHRASHRVHHGRKKKYARLSKAEARLARIQRKLARSQSHKHVVVVPKAELTSSQRSYLSKLREKIAGRKESMPLPG